MVQANEILSTGTTPLLSPRRAIIIGASSGIGAELARRLAAEGYSLALLARRADLLAALCKEINSSAGEVRAIFPHPRCNRL